MASVSRSIQEGLDTLFLPSALLRPSSVESVDVTQGSHQNCHHFDDFVRRVLMSRMRLPGTFNLINNSLPTAEYLTRYRKLRQRQQVAKNKLLTDQAQAGAARTVNIAVVGGPKLSEKDGAEGRAMNNDEPKGNDGFTKAQDDALIELKFKDMPWKSIAVELGKDVYELKERFKEIKPQDFDRRHQEMKGEGKKDKQWQESSGGGGNVSSAQVEKKDDLVQQQGGKGGKKNAAKGAATMVPHDEGGGNSKDGFSGWNHPDHGWSQTELDAMLEISNEELRTAFCNISVRLAQEHGKTVHPASVAEKLLGLKPQWL